jgi:2-dehydropantoate 2-reductase
MASRVLVVGTGAIGGTIAGGLAEAGEELVGLSSNATIAAAIAAKGYRRRFQEEEQVAHAPVVTDPSELEGVFDWIVLATPPDAVVEAAMATAPRLREGGAFVVMQNGLCEDRVAEALAHAGLPGADAVLGAVVGFGASMPEPGLFERTSEGGFTLGRMDGEDDPRLAALGELLAPIGEVEQAENFAGARWSKLAINCAISTLGTLAGERLGRVLRLKLARRLALEIMTEAVAVASAEGVVLEKVSGTLDLDWIALSDQERRHRGSVGLVAKHTLLLAVGARYRRLRSSMLTALERGRTPPVDYINGEIVTRADAHGLQTPVNQVATQMVHELAEGSRKPAMANIEDLANKTDRRHSTQPPARRPTKGV